ncbi:MAG: lysoplasmalogenase [Cyclobacteriaceae bacterium]|nr:lysoplasmalogenase [Cyclobacteriaceae bacterium]
MTPKLLKRLYGLVSMVHLLGIVFNNQEILNATKPFLIPILLYYVYQSQIKQVTLNTILLWTSLVFAWLGDLAFMQGDTYFLLGVSMFFITQLCYIFLFLKSVEEPIKLKFLPLLPYLLTGIFSFAILLPKTDELLIPVFIYGLSLIGMAGIARLRQGRTNSKSYSYVLVGTILFLISDFILALDKFVWDIPYDAIGIMTTYMGAQVLIIEGILQAK